MDVNLLFVYSCSWNYRIPKKPISDMIGIQLGISYISSTLKSRGHLTELIVLTDKTKKKAIDEHINRFRPKIVFFTAVSTEYGLISKAARYLKKKYPSLLLVMGGPHASMNPEEVINGPFDAVCIGEGEYPILELVNQVEKGKNPSKIRNLWIKKDCKVEKNPTRDFVQDLDSLPFPDRKMWARWTEHGANKKHIILLGRGCPFNCTYCSNHILKKLAKGDYVRFRSINNILKEISEVIRQYPGVELVGLSTETLGADMEFAFELCSKLQRFNKEINNKLSYAVNLRITPKKDYAPLFSAMKKANFSSVHIGLESGSKRIREEVLKRYYSNEEFINAVKLAKKNGIHVDVYVLVGLPGETAEDFKETINCLRECQPDNLLPAIFYPYKTTELYNICKRQGLIEENMEERLERSVAILDLPGFSKRQIQHEYDWMFYNVYKGRRPKIPLLVDVLRRKVMSNYFLFRILRKIKYYTYIRFQRCLGA